MKVFPIGFSIPKCLIVEQIPEKEKFLATIIPGDTSTYIFNEQKEYYNDYKILFVH